MDGDYNMMEQFEDPDINMKEGNVNNSDERSGGHNFLNQNMG